MGTLSILTFNICGLPYPPAAHARFRAFAAHVLEYRPSLITLQEVHTYGLLAELRRGLSDYHVHYRPGLLGPQAGLVTLSLTPARQVTSFPMYYATKSIRALHRGALIVRLADLPVTVINVHLSANTLGDWSPSNRFEALQGAQLGALTHLIEQPELAQRRVIMSGDFNVAKRSELYRDFVDHSGLQDASGGDGSYTYLPEYLPSDRTEERIDHIFTTSDLRAERSERLFAKPVVWPGGHRGYLSNHAALLAYLAL